ncbi:MAG TPA: O-antigen ligase family protein [Acidimicrobiales bacterium]|nr:O-antigen ligase family protein [Acidimicrobiales bacterium]
MALAEVRPAVRELAVAVAVGSAGAGFVILYRQLSVVAVLALVAVPVIALTGVALAASSGRLAVAAWAVAAFTVPLNGVRVSILTLSDVLLIVAVAVTLPSLAADSRTRTAGVSRGVFAGLGAIAFGGVIGTLFAADAGASLLTMSKFVLASAGSVLAVMLWAPSQERIRWFCHLWLLGAVFNAVWAIFIGRTPGARPAGLSTHPNHLAMVCVLGVGLALGLALTGRRPLRGLALAALLPLSVALVLSGSRAAVVGCAVVVPSVAVLARRVQLAIRALFAVGVFALAVLAGFIRLPEETGLRRIIGDPTTIASDAERAEHLSQSLDRLNDHPLTGEGFQFAQEAHNIYLQVAVAAGPLGVLGLFLIAGAMLRASRGGLHARAGPVSGDQALLAGLGGGYAGYLVAGAFQNVLWDRYLWFYVAAAVVLAQTAATETHEAGLAPQNAEVDGHLLVGRVHRASSGSERSGL